MPKETMTPRERWLAILTRQKPDRIPMDYWATKEATAKLRKHLGCQSSRQLLQKLHIDFVVKVSPLYAGPGRPRLTDAFGCKYRNIDYGSGIYKECVFHPLAKYTSLAEIKRNYTWPNPDWWDYSRIKSQIRGNEIYPIRGGGSEPFLIYKKLRGQEQAFLDLVSNPEIVHYCLDRLFGLAYESTLRILEQVPGQIMLVYVAEDMGTQSGLMFSPSHIREFLFPRMKRIIKVAHQAGAFVFHHNDGNIRPIIPDLIEAGIDILNPIQWRIKGMNRRKLKKDFGDKIILHGAMDNQYTLPFGTSKEVKQEVLDNINILGKGGGYILAPCHNIQAVSPPENIVMMYKTGYEYGWT